MALKQFEIRDYLDFLDKSKKFINPDLIAEAQDFEYGQWELPFEAVLLEMIKKPRDEVEIEFPEIEFLAKEADIINGGVLDDQTWDKFLKWNSEKKV